MRRAAAALAVVAFGVAGCGGGGSRDAPPMTRAAYVAAGRAACRDATARIRGLSDDYRRDELRTSAKIGASARELDRDLRALTPPPELRTADRRMTDALGEASRAGREIAGTARPSAAAKARLATAGTQLRASFVALGLPAGCGGT